MIVVSDRNKYTVSLSLGDFGEWTGFAVSNCKKDSCFLYRLNDMKLSSKLEAMLILCEKNKLFTDFIEVFYFKGYLYAVFLNRIADNYPLINMKMINITHEEGVIAIERLLEFVIEQNIPWFILVPTFELGDICYSSDTNEIYLKYVPCSQVIDEEAQNKKAQLSIGVVVKKIFGDNLTESMKVFVNELGVEAISIEDIYRKFEDAVKGENQEESKPKIKNWIKELLSQCANIALPFIAIASLIIALSVFAYVFYMQIIEKQSSNSGIKKIGTVEVSDENAGEHGEKIS